jgi:acetyl-CoA synthetase
MTTDDRPDRSHRLADAVPSDAPGSVEIGFSVPARYNASAILFDNLAAGRGERPAVLGPAGSRNYRTLCEDAARIGNALQAQGLAPGERVLLFLDDTPVYPAVFFGAMRAGLVPLMINTLTPPDLLQFYLQDSGARLAITDAAFAARFSATACRDTSLERIIVANNEADESNAQEYDVAGYNAQGFNAEELGAPAQTIAALVAGQSTVMAAADTHRNDMAFWMYSSGSTGRPKGIVHLHHDMVYTARSYADTILKLTPDDICFSVPKIFFAYGMGNSLTFPFAAGAASLLLPGQPKPETIFGAIAGYRPTVFFGLPTLYTALTKAPGAAKADLSSLRLSISAAEVLSAEVFNGWKALSGLEIVEGLGSTEVLHIYLSNRPEAKKLGAAGRRVPGYEVKLCDPSGQPVEGKQEGVLWVRGDSNMPAYWNRPDKTAETIRAGGWIYTGDRFHRDADGFYFFRGRADDLVKVSGQWVYPLEVELCLADHPAVRECAVVAIEMPDRRMTLRAFVALNDTTSGSNDDRDATTRMLQEHVKTTLLPYKYPRIVTFLDDLPKTGTGKIDRQALLQQPLPTGR